MRSSVDAWASRWVRLSADSGLCFWFWWFQADPAACAFISAAASSFSFCRPAVEYRALSEDFKHQLSRRTGGNLTWHDGRGQKVAGGRTVKLLQQPGTEALQVLTRHTTSKCHMTPSQTYFSLQEEFLFHLDALKATK